MKLSRLFLLLIVLQSSFVFGMNKHNRSECVQIMERKTPHEIMPADCWKHIFQWLTYPELLNSMSIVSKDFYEMAKEYCSHYQQKNPRVFDVKLDEKFLENKENILTFMREYTQKIAAANGTIKIRVALDEDFLFQPKSTKKKNSPKDIEALFFIQNTVDLERVIKQIESLNYQNAQRKYNFLTKLENWEYKCFLCCEFFCSKIENCCSKIENCCSKIGSCCGKIERCCVSPIERLDNILECFLNGCNNERLNSCFCETEKKRCLTLTCLYLTTLSSSLGVSILGCIGTVICAYKNTAFGTILLCIPTAIGFTIFTIAIAPICIISICFIGVLSIGAAACGIDFLCKMLGKTCNREIDPECCCESLNSCCERFESRCKKISPEHRRQSLLTNFIKKVRDTFNGLGGDENFDQQSSV